MDSESPYFNFIEKRLIRLALNESEQYLDRFYRFSPREWFNFCYSIETGFTIKDNVPHSSIFAEVKKLDPIIKKCSDEFQRDQYIVCLFDKNIINVLKRRSSLELYPLMVYILTHELVHIARFSQKLYPFECFDFKSHKKEEEKVHNITFQMLKSFKMKTLEDIASLYKYGL